MEHVPRDQECEPSDMEDWPSEQEHDPSDMQRDLIQKIMEKVWGKIAR